MRMADGALNITSMKTKLPVVWWTERLYAQRSGLPYVGLRIGRLAHRVWAALGHGRGWGSQTELSSPVGSSKRNWRCGAVEIYFLIPGFPVMGDGLSVGRTWRRDRDLDRRVTMVTIRGGGGGGGWGEAQQEKMRGKGRKKIGRVRGRSVDEKSRH